MLSLRSFNGAVQMRNRIADLHGHSTRGLALASALFLLPLFLAPFRSQTLFHIHSLLVGKYQLLSPIYLMNKMYKIWQVNFFKEES